MTGQDLLPIPALETAEDPIRSPATCVRAAAARFGVPLEPIFRADDDALLPVDTAPTGRFGL